MKNKPILFIDSGIGGLLYCREFLKNNPKEEVCYLADNENFPYGTKTKDELCEILVSLIGRTAAQIDPKIVVLACNTAAISALETLRVSFPNIPFVGTVPAIKPAAAASKNKKIGILGTARTIEDPYNQKLAGESGNQCEITAVAAPDLVNFVEERYEKSNDEEKTLIVKKYIGIFRAQGADTLVLGCTHFLYLLDIFHREASADIKVFDSLDGIKKRVEFLLDENSGALRSENSSDPVHRLLLTGKIPEDSLWYIHAKKLNFKLIQI